MCVGLIAAGWLDGTINMVHWFSVKTTLEIPDSVYRRIKARAAANGHSVKVFVNEAVIEKLGLAEGSSGSGQSWRALFGRASTKTVQGIQRRIDEEFSKVNLEEWR